MSTALVYDLGGYPYFAQKLTEGFDRVIYFVPYTADQYPVSRKKLWGQDLPGLEHTDDFFDALDDADVVVFPDTGEGDRQMWLRARGMAVWGSGAAEVLELDRIELKRLMRAKKMALPRTWILDGMDELRAHLMDPKHEDQFIKVSEVRGDFETFNHKDWWLTAPWFRRLDHRLGPMRNRLQFIAEEKIDGVEVAIDEYCVDGEFPSIVILGYEEKDTSYVGAVLPYRKLPQSLRELDADLQPVLKELGCRSMFSAEARVTEEGVAHLIDPCMRVPSPPGEVMLEAYSNWPTIVAGGAHGELVDPEPTTKFVAEILLSSTVANEDFLPLRIPDEYRHLVKLHGHAIVEDVDYVVAIGMDVIGGACGLGDTMEDAITQALAVAEAVEGEGVTYDEAGFDRLREKVEKGKACGIDWPD